MVYVAQYLYVLYLNSKKPMHIYCTHLFYLRYMYCISCYIHLICIIVLTFYIQFICVVLTSYIQGICSVLTSYTQSICIVITCYIHSICIVYLHAISKIYVLYLLVISKVYVCYISDAYQQKVPLIIKTNERITEIKPNIPIMIHQTFFKH